MEKDFLQSYLKTGLFEIGDSDDRLEKLKKAITELQEKLRSDYSLLHKYSLVAIDPNVSDTEPTLISTESIIVKYWETLRSKYPEMPRTIIRGVILNAIYNLGLDDPIAARIIYLTSRNFYPYAKLNKEKIIVENMLMKFGEIAEQSALETWSFTEDVPTINLNPLKLKNIKLGQTSIEIDDLKPRLLEAVHNNPSTNHGSNHGGGSPWGEHFASTAANGIASVVNKALLGLTSSLSENSIENPINEFFTTFKKSLDENLKISFSSLSTVERRSKLLWWKETLYSSSLKKSYRGLDNSLLPIVMSIDLNNLVPVITPISVDYLLRDTLFLLNDKKDDKIKFKDYLFQISKDSIKEILRPYFSELNEDDGRITFTEYISLLVHDRLKIGDFEEKTGIKENDDICITDIAVAVLHDLLTMRLIRE